MQDPTNRVNFVSPSTIPRRVHTTRPLALTTLHRRRQTPISTVGPAVRRLAYDDQEPDDTTAAFFRGLLDDDANDRRGRVERVTGTNFGLSGFTTDQLHSLTPYGAMLDRMSADQISELLSKTTGSTPDGRALFASKPTPKRNFLDPQRRFVLSPGGDKLHF